ncbi:hypothetical protein BD626DRAFT_500344 [Schizophyllum amplum]|uniref:Thiaminase-2/PQQC domain-containing protein n=1 Tax=Schizophyllum amplum TaxID=97359 RepID=A0A550CA94_9AGAR|nr:hypothetical protein BD626DRAFT_500344 [Auriculariopsis ampla]
MQPVSHKLTTHLASLREDLYSVATRTHPFLAAAGSGKLPASTLGYWLSQDKIYASQAYPKFIGHTIAGIPYEDATREALNKRVLSILLFSLQNVERKGTRDYTAEMARLASASLEENMVFLWAMEKAYLDVWTNVKSGLGASSISGQPINDLSENWTCEEFVKFVDDLGDIVDDFDIQPDSASWKRAEEVWERTIELEASFWPEIGEEKMQAIP